MFKRVLLTALVAVTVTSLTLLTEAAPANACLLPCLDKEPTPSVLGGGMPDILLGLLVGVLLAIVASLVAYRSGVRNGLRQRALVETVEHPEEHYR